MALVKCKECGKDVSTKAAACPNCGAKVKKPSGLGTTVIVILVSVVVMVIVFGNEDPGKANNATQASAATPAKPLTQAEQAAADAAKAEADAKKKKADETVFRAQIGAKVLKSAMRDPDSLKFASVLAMESGAVCYEYRARNGFGGMNFSRAVLGSDGKTFKGDDEAGFTKLWNRECAGKEGDEIGSALQHFL